jgi:hypothetical protein
MAEKIKLVQGDTRPYIRATLKDADGTVINVSSATVNFKFRQTGSPATLFTVVCSKPNGGSDGLVIFNFPQGGLDVEPGAYEGELEIVYGVDDVQTVYDILKFSVRAQFA